MNLDVMESELATAPGREKARATLRGHLRIIRADYWVKNVFVLPGIAVALIVFPQAYQGSIIWKIVLGFVATCLVASSNYVLNEVLDAPFDRLHPSKCNRPVPAGKVSIPLAYAQWLALMAAGVSLAAR